MKKSKNEIIAMWFQDFKQLSQSFSFKRVEFIMNVFTITTDDYKKFFNKIKKKLFTLKKLRKCVFKVYHKWIKV